MIDYVIKINDIDEWRASLRLDESISTVLENGEVKASFSHTGIIPSLNNQTVAICRLSTDQHDAINKIDSAIILGSADGYIKEYGDINWAEGGELSYHGIYSVEPVTFSGDDGDYIYTPPLLHCVLSS